MKKMPSLFVRTLIDSEIHANFESLKKAENYILFLKGERNKI